MPPPQPPPDVTEGVVYCVCRQAYSNRFMVECDHCREWFHGSCIGLKEYDSFDIENYHCPRCTPEVGPTIRRAVTNNHRHDAFDPEAASKPTQTGTPAFLEELQRRFFTDARTSGTVRLVPASSFNEDWIEREGFTQPVICPGPDKDLGLELPPSDISLKEIERDVGSSRPIDVIDVRRQHTLKLEMKDFVDQVNDPKRKAVLNCISLEVSDSDLSEIVFPPAVTRSLSWAETVWPASCELDKPKVSKYCLISPAGSFTDFHIDFGGSSVWYQVLRGEKLFYLVSPTPSNLSMYARWCLSASRTEMFFADQADSCYRLKLSPGETLFLPSGWIHAVFTPVDSLAFGGNFLHSYSIPLQLSSYELEGACKTDEHLRFPKFETLNWFAASHLTNFVSRKNKAGARISDSFLTGLRALLAQLRVWMQEKDNPRTRLEPIPISDPAKLLREFSKEIRHAERISFTQVPPKPERESSRQKKPTASKDYYAISRALIKPSKKEKKVNPVSDPGSGGDVDGADALKEEVDEKMAAPMKEAEEEEREDPSLPLQIDEAKGKRGKNRRATAAASNKTKKKGSPVRKAKGKAKNKKKMPQIKLGLGKRGKVSPPKGKSKEEEKAAEEEVKKEEKEVEESQVPPTEGGTKGRRKQQIKPPRKRQVAQKQEPENIAPVSSPVSSPPTPGRGISPIRLTLSSPPATPSSPPHNRLVMRLPKAIPSASEDVYAFDDDPLPPPAPLQSSVPPPPPSPAAVSLLKRAMAMSLSPSVKALASPLSPQHSLKLKLTVPPQQSPSSTPDHSPRLPSSDVPSSSLQRRLANSPTTREAVASMLSMGGGTVPLPEPEPSRRKSSRSRKRKRRESFDVEDDDEDFQDAAMSQVYQDDEFVYPSLDVSDEEEESVKPKSPVKRKKKSQSGRRRKGIVQAHEKEDTAWNPHNRISVSSPRNKREGRPGAKREAVERGLMEAREHGRRRKSQSRKLPSKSSSKRESFPSSSSNAKGRDHSPTHSWSPSALSPPSSETPPQGSSFHPSSPQASPQETSSAPDDPRGAAAGVNFAKVSKKPKKGMATAKQRLGKILKIHKMWY